MPELMQALSVLAVGWAVLLPLLARFSMRFDGIGQGAAGLAYGPHAKGSIHHV